MRVTTWEVPGANKTTERGNIYIQCPAGLLVGFRIATFQWSWSIIEIENIYNKSEIIYAEWMRSIWLSIGSQVIPFVNMKWNGK